MYHSAEDEKHLFRDIEENARIGREARRKIIEELDKKKKIEEEKFKKLIKKVEEK